MEPRGDGLKWLLVCTLIAGSIFANEHYSDVAWAIRVAVGIVVAVVVIVIALQTSKGVVFGEFIKHVRLELRKVVWPTRQETKQTTWIVIAMVVASSLLVWGMDTVLLWVVGWLTGQRG